MLTVADPCDPTQSIIAAQSMPSAALMVAINAARPTKKMTAETPRVTCCFLSQKTRTKLLLNNQCMFFTTFSLCHKTFEVGKYVYLGSIKNHHMSGLPPHFRFGQKKQQNLLVELQYLILLLFLSVEY